MRKFENLNKTEQTDGKYNVESTAQLKREYGQLSLEAGKRNMKAQKNVPGKLKDDHAGHMIAISFGGEALTAQNKDINTKTQKRMENKWRNALKNDADVYVDMNAYITDSSGRPDTYFGESIIEKNGKSVKTRFSYTNESFEEQQKWKDIIDKIDGEEEILPFQEIGKKEYASELLDDSYELTNGSIKEIDNVTERKYDVNDMGKIENSDKAEKVKETDVNEQKSDSEKITSWVDKLKAVFNKKDVGEKEEEKIEPKNQILQTPEQNQDTGKNKFVDSLKVQGTETH